MNDRHEGRSMSRALWRLLGFACLGLAGAGVVLPILPTTPFLLVAAWAFGRSSPEMHAWLHAHPRYGVFLRDWQSEGAIPRRAKIAAICLLAVSWSVTALLVGGILVPAIAGGAMLLVALFLITRPSPARERSD
ncbi:uncharacterized membrane protein YbaN (DUF454 family) [Constrictibacter sp. MBR-5]|uniref:YbaN family protein n=1 Tax=Constrictibacter sp. MBR-5 TaxID=3156467 RepID=UPI0033983460